MKNIIMLVLAGSLFCSCGPNKDEKKQKEDEMESVVLDHKAIPGKHCESSAILNVLSYMGFDISEIDIIGAGAAPGFMLEKSDFPFLGCRNDNFKEIFAENCGLGLEVRTGLEDPEWEKITSLLKNDIPLVLRVDMRYLTYRYAGSYGPDYMSFGWHLISLFAIDWQNKTALVGDTEYGDLQSVAIADLDKARFSSTKVFPPQGEYYWFRTDSEHFNPDWPAIAETALRDIYSNMEQISGASNISGGINGLADFANDIKEIAAKSPAYMLAPIFDFHYGCIETNGTGGAGFRTMFGEFLEKYLPPQVKILSDKEAACEKGWHDLAGAYKNAAAAAAGDMPKAVDNIAAQAEKLYELEKDFLQSIKLHYGI